VEAAVAAAAVGEVEVGVTGEREQMKLWARRRFSWSHVAELWRGAID